MAIMLPWNHIPVGKSDHVLLLLQSQEGATPGTSPQRQRWGTGAHRRWWRWWQSRQDGEVWKDWKDWGGFIWCGVQMSQQRDNAARRHQEICGVRGRPSHQEDCNAGNSHAEGKLSLSVRCKHLMITVYFVLSSYPFLCLHLPVSFPPL